MEKKNGKLLFRVQGLVFRVRCVHLAVGFSVYLLGKLWASAWGKGLCEYARHTPNVHLEQAHHELKGHFGLGKGRDPEASLCPDFFVKRNGWP